MLLVTDELLKLKKYLLNQITYDFLHLLYILVPSIDSSFNRHINSESFRTFQKTEEITEQRF